MSIYGIDWSKGMENLTDDDYNTIFIETTRIIETNDTENDIAAAHYDRAIIYCKTGDYEAIIDDLTAAIELDFYAPDLAYYNRGIAYYRMKDYERALSDLNEVKRLDPDDIQTRYMIEVIKSERAKALLKKAQTLLKKAQTLLKKNLQTSQKG